MTENEGSWDVSNFVSVIDGDGIEEEERSRGKGKGGGRKGEREREKEYRKTQLHWGDLPKMWDFGEEMDTLKY